MGEGGGERYIMYLSLPCHHENDSCIQDGQRYESHFYVLLIVKDKVTRPQTTTFEEKGEP